MSAARLFAKYIPQNILAMAGVSLYVLADTFFIAQAVGSDGITALNLVLPVYSLIFAVGQMIGTGSAIRFSIAAARGETDRDGYFFNALFFGTAAGLIFSAAGFFIPDKVIELFGGDGDIVQTGENYTRIFMTLAPCFIYNHICNAFVRNDGAPSVSMAATLCSSLFNIVMDYVLMFPLGMGMEGAALATACSPILGVLICLFHFRSDKCTVKFKPAKPSFKRLVRSCQLGASAFVGEISSGVTTTAFNGIILGLAGNVGVAAYGVIANTAIVATAVFNGVAQGSQPIISMFYGSGDMVGAKKIIRMGIAAALCLSAVMIGAVYLWTEPVVGVFNSEGDMQLAAYAKEGIRLYFPGFVFAGLNIVGAGALSAMEEAKGAFAASAVRGFGAILVCAFVMSYLMGMKGVWLAFPAAEFITLFVTAGALAMAMKKHNTAGGKS